MGQSREVCLDYGDFSPEEADNAATVLITLIARMLEVVKQTDRVSDGLLLIKACILFRKFTRDPKIRAMLREQDWPLDEALKDITALFYKKFGKEKKSVKFPT